MVGWALLCPAARRATRRARPCRHRQSLGVSGAAGGRACGTRWHARSPAHTFGNRPAQRPHGAGPGAPGNLLQARGGDPAGRVLGVGANDALQQRARLLDVADLCLARHLDAVQVGQVALGVDHLRAPRMARHRVRFRVAAAQLVSGERHSRRCRPERGTARRPAAPGSEVGAPNRRVQRAKRCGRGASARAWCGAAAPEDQGQQVRSSRARTVWPDTESAMRSS